MTHFRLIFQLLLPLLAAQALLSGGAWATVEDSHIHEPLPEWRSIRGEMGFLTFNGLRNASALAPREAFERAMAVLDHFGVTAEDSLQSSLENLQGAQTAARATAILPFLDMGGKFRNYAELSSRLDFFQDPVSKTHVDFQVALAPEGSEPPQSGFHHRLIDASTLNPSERSLEGLRIALDPGHMGGSPWDERAGKYIRDKKGNRLSEGLMVLQLAYLLEEELTRLGAQVLITHRSLRPVTDLPYESFELAPFALNELRDSVPDEWFQGLLGAAAPGPSLYRAFSAHPSFKRIFSESMRWRYFFQRADLDARVEMIRAFQPDLTLVLHMDAVEAGGDPVGVNPKGHNFTKAYVPGGFMADELATREQRRDFARHLLDERAWRASVALSRAVVGQIRSQLGIPFEKSGLGNSLLVEPGVFARNLSVQRRITGSAITYLEALHYNDPAEFAALLRNSRSMRIDGVEHGYSERLLQLAYAVRDGILGFVQAYGR